MNALTDELVAILQDYLRIDTSHPSPAYPAVISLWEARAASDGFETMRIALPSGKQVLIIMQRGINPTLPALALNHHMDVVALSDAALWKYHPLAGQRDGEMIYGRGAQDMKAVGVVYYGALLNLKRRGVALERTVYIVLVPDEEIGGFSGAGMLVKTPEFKALNIGYVIDEGLASGDEKKLLIKVSERKPLQLCIVAQGQAAHGSRLMADNSIHTLIQVLQKFVDLQGQQQLIEHEHPGALLSVHVTSLGAGSVDAVNAIPAQAVATLDLRVPPHMAVSDAYAQACELVAGFSDITMTVIAQADDYSQPTIATETSSDHAEQFYRVLEHAVNARGLKAQKYFAEEASDLRFYLQEGIVGCGLTPFTIAPNIHGINEAVRVGDIELGVRVILVLLETFCKGV